MCQRVLVLGLLAVLIPIVACSGPTGEPAKPVVAPSGTLPGPGVPTEGPEAQKK